MANIRLNVEMLEAIQREKGWNDTELCKRSGVSRSQLWRIKLPYNDPRHQPPGNEIIAGLLHVFDLEFNKLFVVETKSKTYSA